MEYEKHHIMDINIEDETQRNGRDISVFVDTHEMINIEIGNTITIRTDEAGIDDLRDALHRALTKIEDVRYTRMNEQFGQAEDEMIQAGIDAREQRRELSEQQMVDPFSSGVATEAHQVDPFHDGEYHPNDPRNW